ncbi:MAG TPA: gluconokinase [Gammaproteobacteria bacterium]|jgi:carbohydrate kinase (thermoresistant glucokinase family)|nr:gluconokinase [Gammaproteobacteria bacterium]
MSFRIPEHCRVIVLMGVSGSGKTTVGAMLAGRLGCEFADADDFHSAANIEKMHRGLPLDDADRLPWLEAIAAQIDAWHADGQCGVVTCSALKRSYRDVIIGDRADVQLVYLRGEQELITRRMIARQGHFMPVDLLASQFAVLEEPAPEERAITVSIGMPPAAIVSQIVEELERDGP